MDEDTLQINYKGNAMVRLLKYAKPYAGQLALASALVLLLAAVDLYKPTVIADTIDNFKIAKDYSLLVNAAIKYAVVLAIGYVASYVEVMTLQKAGQSILQNIRTEVYKHIQSLSLRFFDLTPVGKLVTRATNDVESLNNMYSGVLVRLFRNFVTVVGYAIVMILLDGRLAMMSFVLIPVVFITTYYFRKLSRRIYRIVRNKISDLNTFLSENISGMKVIQIFGREKRKFEEFDDKDYDLYLAHKKELLAFAIFRPIMNILASLAKVIILYFGAEEVLKGSISTGTLYLFVTYIGSFYQPIQEIAEQFSTLQSSIASAEKIFTILDTESLVVEKENPIVLPEIKGRIEFDHVWFAYDNENFVLRDVSFVIEPGEKVAFVGATGAGKSSILNLIGRYYDIQKGNIYIDGVNIKDISIEQLRGAIGQMQQDVFIFEGSIKKNIALYDDISMEEIKEAAKTVNASTFIEKLPNKYDEPVVERGATLSAGERQLLSFARTIAHKPTILVMDEATANIDTETELLIQNALEKMMEGRTTIMVAHRLSTIQHADCIMVMSKGKIREQGTHQQLLAQDGIYKKLYELQVHHQV